MVTDLVAAIQNSGRKRAELAAAAGVSERMVYYVITGRCKSVGADVLTALARALGKDVVLRRARERQT